MNDLAADRSAPARGRISVPAGDMFMVLIRSRRGGVIGVVEALKRQVEKSASDRRRTRQLQALGFEVQALVDRYQIGMWDKLDPTGLAATIAQRPALISAPLEPEKAAKLWLPKGQAKVNGNKQIAVPVPPATLFSSLSAIGDGSNSQLTQQAPIPDSYIEAEDPPRENNQTQPEQEPEPENPPGGLPAKPPALPTRAPFTGYENLEPGDSGTHPQCVLSYLLCLWSQTPDKAAGEYVAKLLTEADQLRRELEEARVAKELHLNNLQYPERRIEELRDDGADLEEIQDALDVLSDTLDEIHRLEVAIAKLEADYRRVIEEVYQMQVYNPEIIDQYEGCKLVFRLCENEADAKPDDDIG